MRYFKFLALLFIFFFTMALFAQNMQVLSQSLDLRFNLLGAQWFDLDHPIYLYLLSALVLGGVLATLFFFTERLRLSNDLRRVRSRLASVEQEVNSLRNLPLQDEPRPFAPAASQNGDDADHGA